MRSIADLFTRDLNRFEKNSFGFFKAVQGLVGLPKIVPDIGPLWF